ncbi:MAG: hypothetical protein GY904_28765 [Planctomycetaceae bacterium]|nr:hypothetical protein [Planctomycetaceae bacterium]
MPDSRGAQTATAVYQSIAPKATDEHRNESLDWLNAIDPQTEELDFVKVITTLESIYSR